MRSPWWQLQVRDDACACPCAWPLSHQTGRVHAEPIGGSHTLPSYMLQRAAYANAGVAAEGLRYEEVMGQTADLFDLQRILLRSKTRLSDAAQQQITRWAVWRAAALLKQYSAEHEAVQAAISGGASVDAVVRAIEGAGKA